MLEKKINNSSQEKKLRDLLLRHWLRLKKGKKDASPCKRFEIQGQFKHYPKNVATSETILYAAKV